MLEETSRNTRLLHILFWSQIDETLSPLRTKTGMQRLMQRGVMTRPEYEALTSIGPMPMHNVVLQWILCRVLNEGGGGNHGGTTVGGGAGFESTLLTVGRELRGLCGTIPDEQVDRMPLAYVHCVHLMVDSLLFLTPIALYPKVGALSVPLTGILTLFYRGLLELSKSFLDPFGNEGSKAQNIRTDVLINEGNAGSTRWWRGGEKLPFAMAEEGSRLHGGLPIESVEA